MQLTIDSEKDSTTRLPYPEQLKQFVLEPTRMTSSKYNSLNKNDVIDAMNSSKKSN